MKALSVRQPWASLIASGTKTIEVRSWRTHYRGKLVICASGRPSLAQPNVALPGDMPLGASICVVELVDCREIQPGDDASACFDGPVGFAWVLRAARAIVQTPIKGRLSFFDVDIPLTPIRHPRRIR